MTERVRFLKREQFYRSDTRWHGKGKHNYACDATFKRGLPVIIDGVRYPDAEDLMHELAHWYIYADDAKIVIQGLSEGEHDALLALGAFVHPSGSYTNVVRIGPREPLLEIIDTISRKLRGHAYVMCSPTFAGRDWRNPPA